MLRVIHYSPLITPLLTSLSLVPVFGTFPYVPLLPKSFCLCSQDPLTLFLVVILAVSVTALLTFSLPSLTTPLPDFFQTNIHLFTKMTTPRNFPLIYSHVPTWVLVKISHSLACNGPSSSLSCIFFKPAPQEVSLSLCFSWYLPIPLDKKLVWFTSVFQDSDSFNLGELKKKEIKGGYDMLLGMVKKRVYCKQKGQHS